MKDVSLRAWWSPSDGRTTLTIWVPERAVFSRTHTSHPAAAATLPAHNPAAAAPATIGSA